MASPGVLRLEEVVVGKTFTPEYHLTDVDGNDLDLTLASVDVEMRVFLRDGSAVVVRKKSSGGTHYLFPSGGVDGWIRFLWAPADVTWPQGLTFVQIVYKDSGTTPATDSVWAEGWVKVVPYKTADIVP